MSKLEKDLARIKKAAQKNLGKPGAQSAKKRSGRRRKQAMSDRITKIVTAVAILMAVSYILVRIINWFRFF